MYNLTFSRCCEPQFTHKIFEIDAIATKKPPTYTIKDEQEEVLRGEFYEAELIGVICVWIRLQSSWFPTDNHSAFHTTRSVHLLDLPEFLAGASEFGRAMGGRNFRYFLPINVPKRYRGEISVLR